jgi:tRNA threonylcarbamoyl adenosine modification protein (Sua5/YciO/YrdC/YwlC family)
MWRLAGASLAIGLMVVLYCISENIQQVADAIRAGAVVVFPTETVYALACDATNPGAIEKIFQIKSRDQKKALSLLVADIETIERYAEVSLELRGLINKFSPGPITYVLDVRSNIGIPEALIKSSTLGFRIPNHQTALEILQKCGVPLIGTSVNKSGGIAATSIDKIGDEIKEKVDIILDGGESEIGISSTVVKIDLNNSVEILRDGSVSREEIIQALSGTN